MAQKRLPKLISFRKAVKPRFGIVYYASVASASRPGQLAHMVTVRRRADKFVLNCGCEDGIMRPGKKEPCIHKQRVMKRLEKIAS